MFDTPQGMKLLSCEVGGKPVAPVDLGVGMLKVTLAAAGGQLPFGLHLHRADRAARSGGRNGQVGAAQGSIVHRTALVWQLDLPAGYQAETHGNLTRQQVASGAPPARITLSKNLCRDERPEVQVFYQRSDLNH